MASIAKVRQLIETITRLAIYLNDDEISDIGKILLKATNRMLREAENEKNS